MRSHLPAGPTLITGCIPWLNSFACLFKFITLNLTIWLGRPPVGREKTKSKSIYNVFRLPPVPEPNKKVHNNNSYSEPTRHGEVKPRPVLIFVRRSGTIGSRPEIVFHLDERSRVVVQQLMMMQVGGCNGCYRTTRRCRNCWGRQAWLLYCR